MALGPPRSIKIEAIRKRWEGTAVLSRQEWLTPERVRQPRSWSEARIASDLPSAEQAALDIAALFDFVIYLQAMSEDARDRAEMYDKVVDLVGHGDFC